MMQDKGFGVMIGIVTVLVICQILPLIFAIVVKGWRVKQMKVLFAVGNEKISEAIIKEYQKNYSEEIISKNVYYFNAIQKELQKR